MSIKGIMTGLILLIVAFIFVLQVIPTIEAVSTENITNSTTQTIANIGIWAIPVLALCAIFYGAFKLIRSRRGD